MARPGLLRHAYWDSHGLWLGHAKLYLDLRDWWVGYYRGAHHHYVCVLPTLVLRWPRGR